MKPTCFPRSGAAVCLGASLFVATAWGFNNDGQTDILWRNYNTGENAVWLMNGATYVSSTPLPMVSDLDWKIVGTGDFNKDGQLDILWRHATTGQNAVWYMNGSAYLSSATLQSISDTNWEIVGTGYFNADGNIDLLWRNRVTGDNAIWFMNGKEGLCCRRR